MRLYEAMYVKHVCISITHVVLTSFFVNVSPVCGSRLCSSTASWGK